MPMREMRRQRQAMPSLRRTVEQGGLVGPRHKRAIILSVVTIILLIYLIYFHVTIKRYFEIIEEATTTSKGKELIVAPDKFASVASPRQQDIHLATDGDEEKDDASSDTAQQGLILPKRVISILGPESSGTTFLTTTIAHAVGADLGTAKTVDKRARTADGTFEIQHLSLPWGWHCEKNNVDAHIIEALVPEECYRIELEDLVWMEKYNLNQRQKDMKTLEYLAGAIAAAKEGPTTETEIKLQQQCREEAFISEESNLSCGAKCGTGVFNGYALYPRRFSINITSHIDWYLQRGVDVTVILSTRDRAISKLGKGYQHCPLKDAAQHDDEVALKLMKEGVEKYGEIGSIEKNRVIVSSYEALMSIKNEYLFGLYKRLRINSTYVPSFEDGNEKYVTVDANVMTKMGKDAVALKRNASSAHYSPDESTLKAGVSQHTLILPKQVVTVVGLETTGGIFLSKALGEALSANKEYAVQHISLPHRRVCNESNVSEINANDVSGVVEGNMITVNSATYVNITSHIQWYLTRGVDVKVVWVLRDKSITRKEKLRDPHCHLSSEAANAEYDTALEIMRDAYRTYGEQRVMIVSYEGLMQLKQSHLFGLYSILRIESKYIPDFVDENGLYVSPKRPIKPTKAISDRLARKRVPATRVIQTLHNKSHA